MIFFRLTSFNINLELKIKNHQNVYKVNWKCTSKIENKHREHELVDSVDAYKDGVWHKVPRTCGKEMSFFTSRLQKH